MEGQAGQFRGSIENMLEFFLGLMTQTNLQMPVAAELTPLSLLVSVLN